VTHDAYFSAYISALNAEMDKLKDDLLLANFTDLYHVGLLQGRAAGLAQSFEMISQVYQDLDN